MKGMRRVLPALPRAHFMGLTPVDVWVRLLGRGGAWRRIPARYWVRLAWCVFTSVLGTLLTLPERVAWAVWDRMRPSARAAGGAGGSVRGAEPEVVCILGYFRSGTTHLHYLLSCDPASVSPRWFECLAPQGWAVSWAFLRWFLVPFLGSTRPQDDVAIGPEWPAEDDFALCNWSLSSSLPGRMVLPREWEGPAAWKHMHALERAGEAERARWRRSVKGFSAKVVGAARLGRWVRGAIGEGREARVERVLLKNPSHTARVRMLLEAFGAERVRVVHIARDPAAVVRSNVAMHARFEPFVLQDLPDESETRRRIIEEYDATERLFLEQVRALPPERLVRMRYEDLVADPVGQVRRIYTRFGWAWTPAVERRVGAYLREVADYRAGSKSGAGRGADEPVPELAWMRGAFAGDAVGEGDQGTVARAGEPPVAPGAPRASSRLGLVDVVIAALLVAAAWLGLAWVMGDRLDWLTWPTGVAVGLAMLRSSRRGTVWRGVAAAGLTAAVVAVVAFPATCLAFYRGREPMPWVHVWYSTRDGLMAVNNLVWVFLGVMTAFRLGSRRQAGAPGEGGERKAQMGDRK